MADARLCTLRRDRATRPCGRDAVFHVLTGRRPDRQVGLLCSACGSWMIRHGRFADLHALTDECRDGGTCPLLLV